MPTDAAASRAIARKEALVRDVERYRADIERCETEIREIDTFLTLYARFADDGSINADAHIGEAEPSHAKTTSNGVGTEDGDSPPPDNAPVSQEKFESDARKLLMENGRPMKRGQLIKSFRSHGLRVGGNDESKNFGTKIWKARERFINISGEGYWPRDVDCPMVGYKITGNHPQFTDMDQEEAELFTP